MIHQAQNLVDCFLSEDFSNYTGAGLTGFSGNNKEIYFNGMLIIYKSKNDIVICQGLIGNYSVMTILNLFPKVVANVSDNKRLFINGVEWDGKKTNLSLFI